MLLREHGPTQRAFTLREAGTTAPDAEVRAPLSWWSPASRTARSSTGTARRRTVRAMPVTSTRHGNSSTADGGWS